MDYIELTVSASVRDEQMVTDDVPVCLSYFSGDPYAVTMESEEPDGRIVAWEFSRDLLARGCVQRTPHGDGDVKVHSLGEALIITVTGDTGITAYVYIPRKRVQEFIRSTLQMVPRGQESEFLDIDFVIKELMEGA